MAQGESGDEVDRDEDELVRWPDFELRTLDGFIRRPRDTER